MRYEEELYIDLAPSFGCRNSALTCDRMTRAVTWVLKEKGKWVKCYLDDFVGTEQTKIEAKEMYEEIKALTKHLGPDLSIKKCIPPMTSLTWLEYTIDTVAMTVTLPQDKITETIELCKEWLLKTHASRKQLRSLFGKLKHIATCVPQATRFLSRILDTLRQTPFKGSHALDPEIKKDLQWFITSARALNGIFLIPLLNPEVWEIECDSSRGAYSKTNYYAELYDVRYLEEDPHITHLKALNILHAITFLLPPSPNNYIIVNIDSKVSQQVLDTGKGRDMLLTACSRELWYLAAEANTDVRIKHKPGNTLVLADALSRSQTLHLRQKAQHMCKQLGLTRVQITPTKDILSSVI